MTTKTQTLNSLYEKFVAMRDDIQLYLFNMKASKDTIRSCLTKLQMMKTYTVTYSTLEKDSRYYEMMASVKSLEIALCNIENGKQTNDEGLVKPKTINASRIVTTVAVSAGLAYAGYKAFSYIFGDRD